MFKEIELMINKFLTIPQSDLPFIEQYSFSITSVDSNSLLVQKTELPFMPLEKKLQAFADRLATCTSLTSIDIDYGRLGALEKPNLLPLLQVLSKALRKQIKDITFSGVPASGVNLPNWQVLCAFLASFSNLENFCLDSFYIESLDNNGWGCLGQVFKRLVNIKHFSIIGEMDVEAYPKNSWHVFCAAVSEIKKLEHLSIIGCGLNKLTLGTESKPGHWRFFAGMFKDSSPKKLTLSFNNLGNIQTARLIGIAACWGQLGSVVDLDLTGNWDNSNDMQHWGNMGVVLRAIFFYMRKLERLNFARNDVFELYEDEFNAFCAALTWGKNIKELVLNRCLLGLLDDKRFQPLSAAISAMISLEKIHLEGCFFNVKQWSLIGPDLAKLPKLTAINLSEHYSGVVGEEELELLARPLEWQACFAELSKLSHLNDLDVSGNTLEQLDDNQWQNCLTSIFKFPSLRHFHVTTGGLQLERLHTLYNHPQSPLLVNRQGLPLTTLNEKFCYEVENNRAVIFAWYASIARLFAQNNLLTADGPLDLILQYWAPPHMELALLKRLINKPRGQFVLFKDFSVDKHVEKEGEAKLEIIRYKDLNLGKEKVNLVVEQEKCLPRKRSSSFFEMSESQDGVISRKNSRHRLSEEYFPELVLSEDDLTDSPGQWRTFTPSFANALDVITPRVLSPVFNIIDQMDNITSPSSSYKI